MGNYFLTLINQHEIRKQKGSYPQTTNEITKNDGENEKRHSINICISTAVPKCISVPLS